uniref:Histone-lysine N-methyltransferase n=1 Tax=Mesocestoides corti TaxID=53468 RepID=A0A5K3FNL1_MESCO
MDIRHFTFNPARIVETDIGKNPTDILASTEVSISDESAFMLLEKMLMETPLFKIYSELEKIYQEGVLVFSSDSEFIVEAILGRSVNKGRVYFWIKWEGWPPSFNTWEPEENLTGCEEMIKDFRAKNPFNSTMVKYKYNASKSQQIKDLMNRIREAAVLSNYTPTKLLQLFFERLKPKPPTIHRFRAPKSTSNRYVQGERPHACKRPRWTAKSHASLREAINQFQTMLNTVYSNEAPIYVENKVDLECPPNDFQPIRDYVPHKDVFLPTKAVVGCQCAKNLKPKIGSGTELCWVNRHSGCCAINSGARVPYNLSKKLLVPPGHPVFECNSTCGCGPTCPFRVVQLGRKVPLTVFRTSNGRGWGVKAAERIPKGTFVCEYIGEIITFEEAEQRGQSYDKQRMTYLFDLDFDGETHYTVDAFQMGNVSHFINHSVSLSLLSLSSLSSLLESVNKANHLHASNFCSFSEA